MFEIHEFLLQARLDAAALEAWIEAGWLIPERRGPQAVFSELDLARARLIHDLREGLGVNEEGVAVALDLLDQVHGLRRAMNRMGSALQLLPEPLRQEILARIRETPGRD
jgi:chaperone modulatory protein CbpM